MLILAFQIQLFLPLLNAYCLLQHCLRHAHENTNISFTIESLYIEVSFLHSGRMLNNASAWKKHYLVVHCDLLSVLYVTIRFLLSHVAFLLQVPLSRMYTNLLIPSYRTNSVDSGQSPQKTWRPIKDIFLHMSFAKRKRVYT